MDFIQLPPSNGYKYVLVMVCMFSHWTGVFPCRQASSVAKVLLERLSLPGELLLNFMVIKKPTLLVRYFEKTELFGWFYSTFTALITFSPLA